MKNQSINPKLLAGLGLLVLVAGWFMVVRPQGARLDDARDERSTAEAALTVARQAAATPTTEPSEATAAAEIAVPADPELPAVLRQLQSIAGESGLRYTTVTPSRVSQLPGVPGGSVQLAIDADGSKQGAYVFLNRLATLPRLVVVEQAGLTTASADAGGDPAAQTAAASGDVSLKLLARVFTTQAPAATATS